MKEERALTRPFSFHRGLSGDPEKSLWRAVFDVNLQLP
jgi:hypothetical protein